jgi:hypothetical protein
MNKLVALFTAAGTATAISCAEDIVPPVEGDDKPAGSADGKADEWNWENDPQRFGGTLSYNADTLPRLGRSQRVAWPSTYWPTYEDSINVRWNGTELSPAQKYDQAFNGWTPPANFGTLRPFEPGVDCGGNASGFDAAYYTSQGPLARHISDSMGNGRSRDGVDSDSDGNIDECDDNDGVETWWGLCHAWVPAAMLEDTPINAVTYNGVNFTPSDIQALLITAYNRSSASMVGGRCNHRGTGLGPNGDGTVVERDEHGRPTDDDCRDTNAGAFHVIMANYLGLMQRPIAEDRTYDYEVWNQPVVGFNVTRFDTITAAQANTYLGVTGTTYTFNPEAVGFRYVEVQTTYITESSASTTLVDASLYERHDNYRYVLELNAQNEIIGGEWATANTHPDFLWLPSRITSSSVPHLNINNIRMLVQMSRQGTGGGGTGSAITANGQTGVSIPDDNTGGATSRATVSNSGTVGTLAVTVNITHTYIGDLNVSLTHGSTTRILHNNEGGSNNNINRTFTVTGFEGANVNGVVSRSWTTLARTSVPSTIGR